MMIDIILAVFLMGFTVGLFFLAIFSPFFIVYKINNALKGIKLVPTIKQRKGRILTDNNDK